MSSDCRTCGACCFSDSPTYVPLTSRDLLRLTHQLGSNEEVERLCHRVKTTWYLRMNEGRCVGLEHHRSGFRCSIYSMRPKVCRELVRGTPECLAERAEKRARARALTVVQC